MTNAYIVGAFTTRFGRASEKTVRDLTREAYLGVLADAGMETGAKIEFAWFGNCMMDYWGQAIIRGQVCFLPLVREGLFPERVPMINVEGGCATGSMAFHGAFKDILSGQSDLSLALGVEKLFDPRPGADIFQWFGGGHSPFDREELLEEYHRVARNIGVAFTPEPNRTLPMDTYAVQAAYHMKRYGTTREQIAACAAKNHFHGSLNPKAQYRFTMSPEEVLADRLVVDPFTRAMCSPLGDGAAAILVCSERYRNTLPEPIRPGRYELGANVFTGGKYRNEDEPSLSRVAADKAYRVAGVTPAQIDVAEVHDATSFCEVYQMEMLRFCEIGEGGPFVASGATSLGGQLPVNTSGGLVSKGHPIAATGLSMLTELTTQLRHEAGDRQVEGAEFALQENGGGVIGLEEAACAITILQKV